MDLKEIATQLLADKFGSQVDTGALGAAVSQLIGEGQDIDLAGMVSQFTKGGLGGAVKSWLGDGANEPVSADQITQGLGTDKVAAFASQLGLNASDAADGLAGIIPKLVDQSSKGGSLLDAVGGLASKLLR